MWWNWRLWTFFMEICELIFAKIGRAQCGLLCVITIRVHIWECINGEPYFRRQRCGYEVSKYAISARTNTKPCHAICTFRQQTNISMIVYNVSLLYSPKEPVGYPIRVPFAWTSSAPKYIRNSIERYRNAIYYSYLYIYIYISRGNRYRVPQELYNRPIYTCGRNL